jgi:hypothetical protein
MMKWLMDHLLVRGINRFVPHAFSPKFPDPDCPPHFGADGRDPQFEGFTKLMGYVNRVAHLLEGAVHQADCAVLYHAEAEWLNGNDFMLTQKPAKVLYDAHIDYDIIPLDILYDGAVVEDARLKINRQAYKCLVVPRAPLLPEKAVAALNSLTAKGLPVLYADGAPAGILPPVITPLGKLAGALKAQGIAGVEVEGNYPLLRISHWIRGQNHYFMLFNEDVMEPVKTTIRFPCSGDYLLADLLNGLYSAHSGSAVPVHLTPYQSVLVVFGGDLPAPNYTQKEFSACETLDLRWDIELYDMGKGKTDGRFKPYRQNAEPHNITGFDHVPEFSGIIRYKAEFSLQSADGPIGIDFGAVGQTIKMKLNGKDCGMKICQPYCYDITGIARQGTNTLELEVANTLVHTVKDPLSFYIQIPPSGLMGPVRLLRGG